MTQLLIENGIVADMIPPSVAKNTSQIALMIQDHETALEHLFAFVKKDRSLSTSYIKELHSLITTHQHTTEGINALGQRVSVELIRGEYKQSSNNPIRNNGCVHEYCPPEHVSAEMDRLVEMYGAHSKKKTAPEVEAAWLHHRFTSIHPFQDGNGRVARALASLVFIQAGWFPLVIRNLDRPRYIQSLEAADSGSLKQLVSFFGELQKHSFCKALTLVEIAERASERKQQIHETRKRLQQRKTSLENELKKAINIAKKLQKFTFEQLNLMRDELTTQLGPPLLPKAEFHVAKGDEGTPTDYYYKRQIVEIANQLDYFADTRTYRSWVRLDMRDHIHGVFLLAFHGYGRDFNGLLACSAFWFEKIQSVDTKSDTTNPERLNAEPFIINYRERIEIARARFNQWLDECATRAVQNFEFGAFE